MRSIELGERALIRRITEILGGIDHDDCAVVDIGEDYLVATTDMLHRETDFPAEASPWQMGWMSVAVNLSDIAAMGAEPLGLIMAVGLPGETELELVDGLFSGFRDCAETYGTKILGGDLDCHQELTVVGSAFGRVEKDKILRRKGARPGDLLCTTGTLGDAGLGLQLLQKGGWSAEDEPMIKKLLEPRPRLREGRALALSGAVTSMMDNSDGLALSLYDLSEAGWVGFEVDEEKIPLSLLFKQAVTTKERQRELVLHGGGDFELLFTLKPQRLADVSQACSFTVIGRVVEEGVWLRSKEETVPMDKRGFEHLSPRSGEEG